MVCLHFFDFAQCWIQNANASETSSEVTRIDGLVRESLQIPVVQVSGLHWPKY